MSPPASAAGPRSAQHRRGGGRGRRGLRLRAPRAARRQQPGLQRIVPGQLRAHGERRHLRRRRSGQQEGCSRRCAGLELGMRGLPVRWRRLRRLGEPAGDTDGVGAAATLLRDSTSGQRQALHRTSSRPVHDERPGSPRPLLHSPAGRTGPAWLVACRRQTRRHRWGRGLRRIRFRPVRVLRLGVAGIGGTSAPAAAPVVRRGVLASGSAGAWHGHPRLRWRPLQHTLRGRCATHRGSREWRAASRRVGVPFARV
mmetsp:Transcript_108985/g.314769  ORF Transcript_108985/g.314769 Transcript_108985/m.314769 type:complete len:255 (+) Transcript_108985:1299-2063(+)